MLYATDLIRKMEAEYQWLNRAEYEEVCLWLNQKQAGCMLKQKTKRRRKSNRVEAVCQNEAELKLYVQKTRGGCVDVSTRNDSGSWISESTFSADSLTVSVHPRVLLHALTSVRTLKIL